MAALFAVGVEGFANWVFGRGASITRIVFARHIDAVAAPYSSIIGDEK